MDSDRFEVVPGSIAAHAVSVLVDKATGKCWILDGNNRHDAMWRPMDGGPPPIEGEKGSSDRH